MQVLREIAGISVTERLVELTFGPQPTTYNKVIEIF